MNCFSKYYFEAVSIELHHSYTLPPAPQSGQESGGIFLITFISHKHIQTSIIDVMYTTHSHFHPNELQV